MLRDLQFLDNLFKQLEEGKTPDYDTLKNAQDAHRRLYNRLSILQKAEEEIMVILGTQEP